MQLHREFGSNAGDKVPPVSKLKDALLPAEFDINSDLASFSRERRAQAMERYYGALKLGRLMLKLATIDSSRHENAKRSQIGLLFQSLPDGVMGSQPFGQLPQMVAERSCPAVAWSATNLS
jgi:hypothetical protein